MIKWLFNIALDKWLHITVSMIIVCIIALISIAGWNCSNIIAAIIGTICAFCIGLLKEIVWDFVLGYGFFDIKDIYANFIGSLMGFLLSWVLLSV